MQIVINIKEHSVQEKILWMLEHFKDDGVEIEKIMAPDNSIDSEKYTDEYIQENWREMMSKGLTGFNVDYYKSEQYKLDRGAFLAEKYK